MIVLNLKLAQATTNSTASVLSHGSKFLGFIIEDGFRKAKEHGKTRIPAGKYELIPVSDDQGGKLKFLSYAKTTWKHEFILYLKDVPGFNSVLIHWGNFVEDTEGCLLVNASLAHNDKQDVFYGGGSRDQYKKFYNYISTYVKQGEQVYLQIYR
jgi:hypothetical protein